MGPCSGNVTDYLLGDARPERVALRMLDGDHSYGELVDTVDRIVSCLRATPALPGDRVLLIGDTSPFWVAAYLATLKAGLVCVPIHPATPGETLAHIIESTQPRVVCFESLASATNRTALGTLTTITVRDASTASPCADGAHPVAPDDVAALMFTSGSTAAPRGVMVSHRNIIANTAAILECLPLSADDRTMMVLPPSYCYGASILHTHLRMGASLVVDRRFMYPELVLDRLRDTACTGFAGVPSHFQILLRKSTLRSRALPHLRYLQQAGGHLAPAFLRELRDALPHVQFFVMYGQTEATARLAYLPPHMLESKLGSIGKGIPGVTLRVVGPTGQRVHPGEVGEIVAEGESIALGYWSAPAETAERFRNGRLYTGDLATVDDDGWIYIVDRASHFVKCRGERVSCHAIERRLLESPDIVEAAVVGVPDDVLGEAVRAFVSLRQQVNAPEAFVRRFCQSRLPVHLVPRDIVIVDALPKNAAGKVLKAELERTVRDAAPATSC